MSAPPPYDALLLVSFGGPEKREDVLGFLENVLRGKNVPRERMLEVAEHYYHFDGKSPINDFNRAVIKALESEFARQGPRLPVYWGNRNWHPMLPETLRKMKADGVRRALAFVTSAYSSYSSCRQYLDDIERARQEVGPGAPEVDKIRQFFNHPGFIEPMIERVSDALATFAPAARPHVALVYTAHSIPLSMANTSRYVEELEEASRLVSEGVGHSAWRLVFQSRSGPPTQPWLEPDICDYLRELRAAGRTRDVVVAPIGFLSDHVEVLYDLDTEARRVAAQLGLNMVRSGTAGTHPKFVSMIRELALERMEGATPRTVGRLGAAPAVCPAECCPRPARPVAKR